MEKPKQTLTQMGIIAAIILIGQIFRAVSNTNAPFSVIHFLSSIASVYIVAMAAAILAYPNLGLLVKFQGGRLKVFFKSFGVVCMLYLLAIPMTIVPVLLGVMLMVILMPIGMIAGAVDADVGKYFETISLAIVSPGKSLFFLLIYSPIIYIGAFFKQIIIGTIHLEFESIGELASYLFAMLLVLRNYRKIFTENEPD